jgi:hypothetical protein
MSGRLAVGSPHLRLARVAGRVKGTGSVEWRTHRGWWYDEEMNESRALDSCPRSVRVRVRARWCRNLRYFKAGASDRPGGGAAAFPKMPFAAPPARGLDRATGPLLQWASARHGPCPGDVGLNRFDTSSFSSAESRPPRPRSLAPFLLLPFAQSYETREESDQTDQLHRRPPARVPRPGPQIPGTTPIDSCNGGGAHATHTRGRRGIPRRRVREGAAGGGGGGVRG